MPTSKTCARCEGNATKCNDAAEQWDTEERSAYNSDYAERCRSAYAICLNLAASIRLACIDAGHARKDAELVAEARESAQLMRGSSGTSYHDLLSRLANALEGRDGDE